MKLRGLRTRDSRKRGSGSFQLTVGDLTILEHEPPAEARSASASALLRFRRIALGLALADVTCVVAALLLVELFRTRTFSVAFDLLLVVLVAPVVWAVVFNAFGLYGIRHLSAWNEFRGVISATSVGVVLLMFASFWWSSSLSREWLVSVWALTLLFEMVTRRLFRWWMHTLKRKGTLALRTLLVGTNAEARRLAQALAAPVRGFVPIGYLSTSEAAAQPDGLPVIGHLDDLPRAIHEQDAECVFIASTAVTGEEMMRISRACRRANVEMRVSANLPEILTSRVTIQPIDAVMALSVRPVRLTGAQAALKRSFDLAVASTGLLLTIPLIGLVALAIKITSRGPVVFRQARVTKNGRIFTMYKFRTMIPDTGRALHDRLMDVTRPFFKLQDDPRLTRIGRLLRPLSLDELPQLWNVIRGDMSLVGPRPLPVEQVEANRDMLAPRHEVRAGLTGWWQINGRSDLARDEALRLDLFYIENWSLTLDLYVVLKTIGAILARRGAR